MVAKATDQNLKQAATHCLEPTSMHFLFAKIAGLATTNLGKWIAKKKSRYSEILNSSIQGPASTFS